MQVRILMWTGLTIWGCDSIDKLSPAEPRTESDDERSSEDDDDGVSEAEDVRPDVPMITESGLAMSPPKGPDLDCEADLKSHGGASCAFEELTCGSILSARIGPGSSRFSDDFYVDKQCGPQRNGYTGPESVYSLSIPPNTRAAVFLESPCADLDLASVLWAESTSCPTVDHRTGGCEMDQGGGTDKVVIATVARAENHLLIVDGKEAQDGNYRLSVLCDAYR